MRIKEKGNDFILKSVLITVLIFLICSFSIGQEKYIVTAPRLNVRKMPSAQSTAIGGLSKGDTVNVRSLKNSWAEIDFKKGIGYVSLNYLEPIQMEDISKSEPEPVAEEEETLSLTNLANGHKGTAF